LQNRIFEPFSQEDPLQTGTGLGLAIVKNILQSKGIDGLMDVSSAEGVGTEMKITFDAESKPGKTATPCEEKIGATDNGGSLAINLIGFDESHSGSKLLKATVTDYLITWWGFQVDSPDVEETSDILIVDEDAAVLLDLQEQQLTSTPVVILSSVRGDSHLMSRIEAFEKVGGFVR
jgi:hypothetical protein